MAKGTVNKVLLIGRLGQDPDVRSTGSGMQIARMSLATVDSVKDGDGYKDVTEWHKLVVFGKQAEFCSKYLQKGSQVYVEGSLKTNKWEKDGVTHYTTEIMVRDIQSLSKIEGSGGGQSNQGGGQQQQRNQSSGGQRSSGGGQKYDPFDGDEGAPF